MNTHFCRSLGILLLAGFLTLGFVPTAQAEAKVVAVCAESGGTVTEEHADEPLGVAGLSKLPAVLTHCRAFDNGLLSGDAAVSVSRRAASIGGPTAFLKTGETIAAEELIRAAVMISAGDAIVALMEHAFGAEDVFLQNISLTLKSVGIERTMTDCLGTGERFSCRELLRLGEAALMSETFQRYCTVKYAVLTHEGGRETELASANKLLSTLPGCIGLFTGSSKQDGYCGVFACRRGGTTFLCAVVGAENSSARQQEATKRIEEAFANYKTVTLSEASEPLAEAYPVENGDRDTVDLYTHTDVALLLKKSDGEPQPVFDLPEVLSAPLNPDFSVGLARFYDGEGNLLCELALYPGEAVASTGFRDILARVLGMYVSG